MANITDKKLYAPIQNVQFSNRDYIEKAKQIAKKIVEYDTEGTMSEYHIKKGTQTAEDVAYVRDKASEDRDILKGDFVILAYVDMFREQKKSVAPIEGKGKFLKMSDKLIRAIFENDRDGGKVNDFCTKNRITRTKYYRVLKMDLKQPRDIERIERIRKEVEK